jgi:hypothetical protein
MYDARAHIILFGFMIVAGSASCLVSPQILDLADRLFSFLFSSEPGKQRRSVMVASIRCWEGRSSNLSERNALGTGMAMGRSHRAPTSAHRHTKISGAKIQRLLSRACTEGRQGANSTVT